MRPLPIGKPATQLAVRTPEVRVKGSFARAPKRGTRTRACIKLPQKLWDRIVLLMFICCLFTFLHALFGFGLIANDLHVTNDTFVRPRMAPSKDQEIRAPCVTRVMVDWHGNYELLPSTASALVSPATIPQDAFPDPTPALTGARRGRAPDNGSPSMTTKVRKPVDIPSMFYGNPYDPFRLVFEDSVDGGEHHGLYPVAGPPRTVLRGARARRFGRCLPAEVCL